MYRFALTYIKDRDDAKDIVQDVMVKLWETRLELGLKDNVEAWCMTLTRNKALDQLKRVGRKRKTPIEHAEMHLVSQVDQPDKTTAEKEELAYIDAILKSLSEKQRMVFQLRDVEGYSYIEICDALNLDMNQVKVNIFRARKTIKTNLEKLHSYGYQSE